MRRVFFRIAIPDLNIIEFIMDYGQIKSFL